jgi:hypothetical protein
MEERNIRWGELVGGLLFVGCSVALVISLWETLQKIPYIQFFGFATVSAAMFGVGLYTYHRWKLESTSRGLLIIATLLVPLNFAVMARASQDKLDLLAVVLQVAALGISPLVSGGGSGRSVAMVDDRGRVGSSACMLFTSRIRRQPCSFTAALPAACHGVPLGRVLGRGPRARGTKPASTGCSFAGDGHVALVIAWGCWWFAATTGWLDYLRDQKSAVAPITAAGLTVMRERRQRRGRDEAAVLTKMANWRATARPAQPWPGRHDGAMAVGLAWPQPPLIWWWNARRSRGRGRIPLSTAGRAPAGHCLCGRWSIWSRFICSGTPG